MAELEKAIKGLEICRWHLEMGSGFCDKCPYFGEQRCRFNMANDVYKLIQAQEPRVMTLEEVHEMAWDYCYLEEEVIKDKVLQIYTGKYRIKCITWPSIASCVLTFGDEAYGKSWRCWTSRPSNEQRRAVPWLD